MTRNAAPAAAPGKAPASDTQDIDDFIYLMSHDLRASVRADRECGKASSCQNGNCFSEHES